MYRLGLESILGLRRRGEHLVIAPCVPASWDGFVVKWRFGKSLYEITVENPEHRNRGVAEALMDGARVDARAIPLVDDGAVHRLRVVLGAPGPASAGRGSMKAQQ
jgi:cyclic beta-1,2-glucan synthetase